MTNRLNRLEDRTRAAHSAAWGAFWSRFRTALDGLPSGAFEHFGPIELDDFSDLEDELRAWDSWADRVLPLLERIGDGLEVWPADLPPPPGDPQPLILELISRWRKNPRLPLAPLVTLLALAVAAGGEGG